MKPGGAKIINVLIVEDSRVVAELLTHVLNSDERIRVVGVATDGEKAVEAAQQARPDVITMDIHMPRVDGFEATRRIMETCPTPIVIVSSSINTDEVATHFRAIEAGALAVERQPKNVSSAAALLDTIKLMSEVKVVRRWPRSRYASTAPVIPAARARHPSGTIRVVAIGASTGGPAVLQTILSGLPKNFPVPVLIVQHMAQGFVDGFVEWLGHTSSFPVRVASDGENLEPGQAYVAPDDFHMGVGKNNRILLAAETKENGMCPSVSFLFRSVKEIFGPNAAAVLLTGMGKDGAQELKELKDAGAFTLAQDKESSVVFGMPGSAIEMGAAMYTLPPDGIAKTLATIVTKP